MSINRVPVLALTIYECNEFWDFRSPKCQNNTENNDGLSNENKSKFGEQSSKTTG